MLRPLKNEHTESVFPFKGLCASLMVLTILTQEFTEDYTQDFLWTRKKL